MKFRNLLAFTLAVALPSLGQHVKDSRASLVDVAARQEQLKSTSDPLLRKAVAELHSCVALPAVPAPVGRMEIPKHYVSGSNGAVDPAEAAATRIYRMFENRITSGMNQYLATGSHSESACALAQLDAWAQANALMNYDRADSPQAWYQVEWTLSSAGITDSVLVNDSTLDAAQQNRVAAWLDKVAHKDISFEKGSDTNNNHHYWRGLATTAVGVVSSDDKLFKFGVKAYREAIDEIDRDGAFPKEMARHENAIHYQGFALEPLVLIAQFASRQGMDLYGYQHDKRSLRDAILFFGRAVDDPSLVKPYTHDAQATNFGAGSFAAFAFYAARFGTDGLPPAILNGLKTAAVVTQLGGCTVLLAGSLSPAGS